MTKMSSSGTPQRGRAANALNMAMADHGSDEDESNSDTPWREDPEIMRSPVSPRQTREPASMGDSSSGSPVPHRMRHQQQWRPASASQLHAMSSIDPPPLQATFESPMRSILVSSPPTSSISANTAQASLSAVSPTNGSGSFAALANAGVRRATTRPSEMSTAPASSSSSMPRPSLLLEKDIDDPDATPQLHSQDNTHVSLSQLFVSSPTPGSMSRLGSDMRTYSTMERTLHDTSTLTGHLFHNGFLEGRHSDITIYAFGTRYKLHKLMLDRVPFFSSAFSGGWAESSSSEMVLEPEDIDTNISKAAFELALKRIYGTQFPRQEEQEAVSLFATACWLDMPELVDSCVDAILRRMHPNTLHEFIKLVTKNYYGKAGDRILASAKAMLCREGWEMPYHAWDRIPSEIIREIIGGDPFFVPSEWERWFLATKILNRKLKSKAIETGLVSSAGQFLHPKPSSIRFFAVRFDTIYRRESGFASARHVTEKDEPWVALYTSPDVAPLLVLLDEGIHYVHLRFEQLQQIKVHKDILGVPVLPEKVISDALWMSMELRQRVLNAGENDLELGITDVADEQEQDVSEQPDTQSAPEKGKQKERDIEEALQLLESDSWDSNAKPRRFWIPSSDLSCVMGGTREANSTTSVITGAEWAGQAARMSASLEPAELTWASDFTLDSGRPNSQSVANSTAPSFSKFPPFRFSAEFPNPRTLKEKRKRVYSQTVWYAGSMWNLYIQRMHASKNQQLGIYLHRAKDSSPTDDPLAQVVPASVDDRIGQLEREMLMRKTERRRTYWRDMDLDALGVSNTARASMPDLHERTSSTVAEKDEGPEQEVRSPEPRQPLVRSSTSASTRMMDSDEEDEELLRANRRYNVPTMPPYLDNRPAIKTYFKFYSPDKAGRLLSIYESAPEKFILSRSWGWKSPQLNNDEAGNSYDIGRGSQGLRYMVVLGNT